MNVEWFSSFEHQTVSLSCGTEQLVVTHICLNSGALSQDFLSLFSELLSFLQTKSTNHLIVSDFNIDTHVDAKKLKSLLDQFHLFIMWISPHAAGNMFDLAITKDEISAKDIHTDLSVRSDHSSSCYTPHFNEVERGVYWYHLVRPSVRPSVCPSVRLAICGQNRVRSVSSTMLAGSI